MNKRIHIVISILAVAFITSSCVSTAEFEKMQASKNEEIAALQQQQEYLKQRKTALEQDVTALQQQLGIHELDYSELETQVGTLEQQKAALLAASQQRQQQYDTLVSALSAEVEQGQLKVRQYQNMLSVDLAEQIFFDSGRATLKKGGKDVLKKVGDALREYEDKIIRVVGHTDNVPLAKSLRATFPTNWELSVARATNVVRYLQEVGIPPERMVASGRGEYDPVASNDTAEDRQKNRRIEIMLIDKSLANEMNKTLN